MIQDYIDEHKIYVPRRHGENNKCPALGIDNKCLIYDVRPTICRLWGTAFFLPFKNKGTRIMMACTEHYDVNIDYKGTPEYNHLLRLYVTTLNAMKPPLFLGFTYREFIQDKIKRGKL